MASLLGATIQNLNSFFDVFGGGVELLALCFGGLELAEPGLKNHIQKLAPKSGSRGEKNNTKQFYKKCKRDFIQKTRIKYWSVAKHLCFSNPVYPNRYFGTSVGDGNNFVVLILHCFVYNCLFTLT